MEPALQRRIRRYGWDVAVPADEWRVPGT